MTRLRFSPQAPVTWRGSRGAGLTAVPAAGGRARGAPCGVPRLVAVTPATWGRSLRTELCLILGKKCGKPASRPVPAHPNSCRSHCTQANADSTFLSKYLTEILFKHRKIITVTRSILPSILCLFLQFSFVPRLFVSLCLPFFLTFYSLFPFLF